MFAELPDNYIKSVGEYAFVSIFSVRMTDLSFLNIHIQGFLGKELWKNIRLFVPYTSPQNFRAF